MTAPSYVSRVVARVTPISTRVVGSTTIEYKPSEYYDIHGILITDASLRINGGQAPRDGQDWSCSIQAYSDADGVYTALSWRESNGSGGYTDCTATAWCWDPITGEKQCDLTVTVPAQGTYPGKLTLGIDDTATVDPGIWKWVIRLYWGTSKIYTDSLGGWIEILPAIPTT